MHYILPCHICNIIYFWNTAVAYRFYYRQINDCCNAQSHEYSCKRFIYAFQMRCKQIIIFVSGCTISASCATGSNDSTEFSISEFPCGKHITHLDRLVGKKTPGKSVYDRLRSADAARDCLGLFDWLIFVNGTILHSVEGCGGQLLLEALLPIFHTTYNILVSRDKYVIGSMKEVFI